MVRVLNAVCEILILRTRAISKCADKTCQTRQYVMLNTNRMVSKGNYEPMLILWYWYWHLHPYFIFIINNYILYVILNSWLTVRSLHHWLLFMIKILWLLILFILLLLLQLYLLSLLIQYQYWLLLLILKGESLECCFVKYWELPSRNLQTYTQIQMLDHAMCDAEHQEQSN